MNVVAVERVMSISRAEFMRLLPRATDVYTPLPSDDSCIRFADQGQLISISLHEETDAVIASLRLPRLRVRIEFPADAALKQKFMLRFDRTFQRGGG
ncbi:MAG TPA: hypothetical protein VGK14_13630 [Novimethylophilus sp.]|jgi:hypothetical protein|uniref:hypothetical protein n=1 Tax=Novimethylophilus sp. TaxID=2137426 RepID=UPI002F3FB625